MNSINELLKLKRYETPREGYMDDFVKEFHQRQRETAVKTSRFSVFRAWFREMHMAKWAYAAGLSYACLMAWLLISPSADDTVRGNSAVPVNYPAPTPAAPVLNRDQAEKNDEKSKPAITEPF